MKPILAALLVFSSLSSASSVVTNQAKTWSPNQNELQIPSESRDASRRGNFISASETPTLLSGGIGLIAIFARKKRRELA